MDSPTGPPAALPAWVRTADVATILLGVTVLNVAVFGGIRVGWLFSMSEPWRTLVVLVAVCGLRHYLVRTPALHQRIRNGLQGVWRDEAFRAVWPMALATRLAVLLVGYLAVVSIGFAPDQPRYRFSEDELVNLPVRLDTGWYLDIAMNGYKLEPDLEGRWNIAFFPGYPLVVKTLANALGAQDVLRRPQDAPPPRPPGVGERRTLPDRLVEVPEDFSSPLIFVASSLLVSLLSFGWSLVWLYRLARANLDAQAARGAVLLLAAYPFAVFFSAAYTESLMLLAIAGAFYHAQQHRWGQAAAWGLLAGLTRPNGFLLAGPLAVIAAQQVFAQRASPEPSGRLGRVAVAAGAGCAMPVLGTLAYSAFVYTLAGDPFAWREAHAAWGRGYTGLDTLWHPFDFVFERGAVDYMSVHPIEALNFLATVLTCALIWPVTRRLGAAYGLFMLLNVVPPLLFGGYQSMGRVTSLLFPMFLYLGLVLTERRRQTLVAGFACVQGLAAVLFFTWRPFV